MAELLPITIQSDLAKSAQTFRKDLLSVPIIGAAATLQHMSARPKVRGKETVGLLSGNFEIGPYDPKRVNGEGVTITPRTLETFLGSCIERFDPNQVWQTVYGSLITQGEALKDVPIAKAILTYAMKKLGQNLNMALFAGKRNESGKKTSELFDGFDTITAAEIAAENIATAKKNLFALEAFTNANAVDQLKALYAASSDELQGQKVKLYMPRDVYRFYCEDYQATVGATPYNREYKKTFLEGSDDLCELVPLTSKKGSKFLHLTSQENMLYGFGDGLADEKVEICKVHEIYLSLVATMYFGVQFECIEPEVLMVGQIAG